MDASLSSAQCRLTGISDHSSLVFLLERGLDYIQQGNYTEGVALLTLAREQLSPDQTPLAEVLDKFIQEHADYQRVQQALQEVAACFAAAHAAKQARVASFGKALSALIRELDTPCHQDLPSLLTDAKNDHSFPPSSLPSQKLQQPPASSPPQSLVEESISLPHLFPLSITCFERFEVRRAGKLVALCPSRNGQAILRYLVAQPSRSTMIDTLMALLWPEDEAEVAQPKLHIAVSALRRSLNQGCASEPGGGYILCKNRVYSLNPAISIQVDVDEFLRYYETGRQAGDERIAYYEKACCLYTGPFLREDLYADWSFLQREQLMQTYLSMSRVLASYYLQMKHYEDAAKWATAILKENLCDEVAHQQLMQVYAAQGHRSEAIQQYQRCERVLREELGIPPLPETTHLLQMLFTSEPTSTHKAKT